MVGLARLKPQRKRSRLKVVGREDEERRRRTLKRKAAPAAMPKACRGLLFTAPRTRRMG